MELSSLQETFFAIARCPNVKFCLESAARHPCRAIVEYQVTERRVQTYADFQLPEPWVGQLDIAPLLFVASNPSIGEDDHACGRTSDEDIWESHHLAHGGGRRPYILDGVRTTTADGTPLKMVKYWSSIRKRAAELIRQPRPGVDYAMTELVHCKSPNEIGVRDALDECSSRYMERVLAVSAARVVIAVGARARRWFLGETAPPPRPIARELGGRLRLLVFIPHPSPGPGGPKSLLKRYDADSIAMLRDALVP